MQKVLALFLVAAFCIALAGCAQQDNSPKQLHSGEECMQDFDECVDSCEGCLEGKQTCGGFVGDRCIECQSNFQCRYEEGYHCDLEEFKCVPPLPGWSSE